MNEANLEGHLQLFFVLLRQACVRGAAGYFGRWVGAREGSTPPRAVDSSKGIQSPGAAARVSR
jgi:hypothetical protein